LRFLVNQVFRPSIQIWQGEEPKLTANVNSS